MGLIRSTVRVPSRTSQNPRSKLVKFYRILRHGVGTLSLKALRDDSSDIRTETYRRYLHIIDVNGALTIPHRPRS